MTRNTLVKIDRMSRQGQTPEAITRVAHCSVRTAERVREMACAGHTLQALEAYIQKRAVACTHETGFFEYSEHFKFPAAHRAFLRLPRGARATIGMRRGKYVVLDPSKCDRCGETFPALSIQLSEGGR